MVFVDKSIIGAFIRMLYHFQQHVFRGIFKSLLTFVIATLLLLFADPVVVEVDVGEGELDDVLYGNGAENKR